MKFLNTWVFAAILLWSTATFAHGEDKLGPNGGYVKMPGAFHTEVVPVDKNSLRLYLLDVNWRNPSVADSQVTVTHRSDAVTQAECVKEGDSYLCLFPPDVDLALSGTLTVKATREKQNGAAVTYALPLKLSSSPGGHL